MTEHQDLSRENSRRRLTENELEPWQQRMWCIPKVDTEYVAWMEDVLELYGEPPDAKRPVVCFDETPTQPIGEVHTPLPTLAPSSAAWTRLPSTVPGRRRPVR